jgi:hypothetical protein
MQYVFCSWHDVWQGVASMTCAEVVRLQIASMPAIAIRTTRMGLRMASSLFGVEIFLFRGRDTSVDPPDFKEVPVSDASASAGMVKRRPERAMTIR